jgi:hypothetical protein
MTDTDESIVVSTDDKGKEKNKYWVDIQKHGSAIVIVALLVIVGAIIYCKTSEGFVSPDGVVARRSQRQIRSDTQVDRTWNAKELEKSVKLLNRKASAY